MIIIFNSYSNRIINTKIQFSWVSENASYPFNELGKVTLLTDKYKNDYYISSNGLVELTNIPSENLDSKINLEFNNDNIYQIDTPNLERNMIHSIKISVKNLNKIQFIIRDYNTGNPVGNAAINFNGYALNTDIFGKASQVVSQDKQRKYIDIEVVCKGYKFYIMVDANKPIEILLEK